MPKLAALRRLALGIVALLGVLLLGTVVALGADRTPASPAPGQGLVTRWEELVPREWDPTRHFRALRPDTLDDADPRARQWLQDMRATWDNAPTNGRLDGAPVRLAGYVVPLEVVAGDIREFLLVPSFGACIHVPPPPANQIVHVRVARPLAGLRTMDVVWVGGLLRTRRQETAMGMSGYEIRDATLEPYLAPARP